MTRDKVLGLMLGVAIGDQMGSVVEGKSMQQIAEKHGRIKTYLPGARTTDDTCLTLAVAEGMIESPFNMNTQAKKHIAAFKKGIYGMGGTTRNSLRDMANGCPWNKSGQSGEGRGKGNGVAMKLSLIAPFIRNIVETVDKENRPAELLKAFTFVRDLTIMTHNTQMAVTASFGHMVALLFALEGVVDGVAGKILSGAKQGVKYAKSIGLPDENDNILERFAKLENVMSVADIVTEFGGLSCYCFDSVPGSHALWLGGPYDLNTLFDTIAAGGDTDSTGSMVGALIGALCGSKIFPEHLVEGLDQKDRVVETAEKLCGKLGIE
jgi:poly(ADP-ribose) glycohydrolase ARH3